MLDQSLQTALNTINQPIPSPASDPSPLGEGGQRPDEGPLSLNSPSPSSLRRSVAAPLPPPQDTRQNTQDIGDNASDLLTPHHADLFDNVGDTEDQRALFDSMFENGLTTDDILQDTRQSAQDIRYPDLTQDTRQSTQDIRYPDLAQDIRQKTQDIPPFPRYTPPTMNPAQAALTALGAALDPHHAALDVQGALQGNTAYHNVLYQRALQEYAAETQARENQIRSLLTLAGMQNGRDEAQARLDAEMILRQMQMNAMSQWRGAILQDRQQNHLQQQYERASGLDQMRAIGKQLGYDDAAIQRDFASKQQSSSLRAQADWERLLQNEESPRLRVVDPQRAQQLETVRQAIANQYGIPAETLRQPDTFDSLQQKRNEALLKQWQSLPIPQSGSSLREGEGGGRSNASALYKQEAALDEAQQRVLQAIEQMEQAKNEPTKWLAVQAYNNATTNYNKLNPRAFNQQLPPAMSNHSRPPAFPLYNAEIKLPNLQLSPNPTDPVNPLQGRIGK